MKINILSLFDFDGTEAYFCPKKDKKLAELGVALNLNQESLGNYLCEKYGGKMFYKRNIGFNSDHLLWKIYGKKAEDLVCKI